MVLLGLYYRQKFVDIYSVTVVIDGGLYLLLPSMLTIIIPGLSHGFSVESGVGDGRAREFGFIKVSPRHSSIIVGWLVPSLGWRGYKVDPPEPFQ